MAFVGRNEPCPCGSGRQFKNCCSAEGASAPASDGGVRDVVLAKVLNFAFQPAFDNDHAVAELIFWGDLMKGGVAPEMQWLLDAEDSTIKYNAWFLFDWEIDHSGTAAELFLEEEGARLGAAERQVLTRLANAHLRLYEVEHVKRGSGVRLVDLWTGARVHVVERTATARIVTWDLLAARVAADGLGGNVFEGGLYLYPADAKERIVSHFRRLHRRYARKNPSDDAATFFKKHGMVFHHLWLQLVAFPEPPNVTTSDGDPMVFCRVMFDTPDPEGLQRLLRQQGELQPLADGRLMWMERTPAGSREVGTFGFEGPRLVFETTSQARAERGRDWLETLAGEQIKYRATAFETVAQAMEDIRRPASPTLLAAPDAVDEAPVRELFDRHYRAWLDRPLPALGNRTPRAAAQTRLWRARLLEILKQLENSAERAALAGRPAYDFGWIWQELGLERPNG